MLMVGEDKYLGAVSHDDERNYKRNFVGKLRPIFHPDGNENNKQYINIINHLFNACNRKRKDVCLRMKKNVIMRIAMFLLCMALVAGIYTFIVIPSVRKEQKRNL